MVVKDKKSTGRSALALNLRTLAVATVSLPLLAFVYCVLSVILYGNPVRKEGKTMAKNDDHLQKLIATNCNVANFAPSISAAIGTKPQIYIWQFCVAIHTQSRFMFGFLSVYRLTGRIRQSIINQVTFLPFIES